MILQSSLCLCLYYLINYFKQWNTVVCSWRAQWCHTSQCCQISERVSERLPESRKVRTWVSRRDQFLLSYLCLKYWFRVFLQSNLVRFENLSQWQSCYSSVMWSVMIHYQSWESDWKIMKVTESFYFTILFCKTKISAINIFVRKRVLHTFVCLEPFIHITWQ